MQRRLSSGIPVILTACLAVRASEANELPAQAWFEHNVADAWLHNYDPTLASRRLATTLSFEDDDGGKSTTEFNWSARGALPLGDNHALAYQLGWPVKWVDDGTERISGMADLETRVGLITRHSSCLRTGFGLITKFDTASESGLDNSVFQLRPVIALRWDINSRVNLGLNAEYSFTPRDQGSDDISNLELKIPLALKLTHHWSTEFTYKPRWNFLTDDDRHRLTAVVTRNWGDRRQFAWTVISEVPLSSQSLEWKLGIGFNWYFE